MLKALKALLDGWQRLRATLGRLWLRLLAVVFVIAALGTIWVTNSLLTERFTETTRNRAELRLALYAGNIVSEMQRNAVVPMLLARDPALIAALGAADYTTSSQRLISFQSELGTAEIALIDSDGRTVAATDRNQLGTNHRQSAFFVEALRQNETTFTFALRDGGTYAFSFSRTVERDGRVIGVVAVGVDVLRFEQSWTGFADAVAVLDSEGTVIMATEPVWRGVALDEALALRDPPSAIARALMATTDWGKTAPDTYLRGVAVMRSEARIPFRGWRIVSFTRYDSIRDQVNTFIALEITGFAILLALGFYAASRAASRRSQAFERESAELRVLNARLQRAIAERERAEKDLAMAEQTIAQSSKLAVLGEMSASVSHELNQPLAAMKTYLAGARLLLQRRRPDEALASFQRIDDLIDRMAAITRQLKSFARKGGEAVAEVDMRKSVGEALSIMEPQFKPRRVRIVSVMPRSPVMVMADRIRLEQVFINLLRNALDATAASPDPEIAISLATEGADPATAVLDIRDNGTGIADLEKLFEPFWTTKKPGEGVGLGLAISSGIVTDFGGRLTARNVEGGGAAFEVRLPLVVAGVRAAE